MILYGASEQWRGRKPGVSEGAGKRRCACMSMCVCACMCVCQAVSQPFREEEAKPESFNQRGLLLSERERKGETGHMCALRYQKRMCVCVCVCMCVCV